MVAGERARPHLREIVRLPAGSAVATYVSMTASRTWRSRSFRDAVMSPNPLAANNLADSGLPGQGMYQRVKPQPSLGRADEASVSVLDPPPLHPQGGSGRQRAAETAERYAGIGAQRKIQALELPLLFGQHLLGVDRRAARRERAAIRVPRRDVPAPRPTIVGMRRGPESQVRTARPVCRVVPRPTALARRVRDFVKAKLLARESLVREQVLVGIALVIGTGYGAA